MFCPPEIIVQALILTCAATLGLSLYAFFSKEDISFIYGMVSTIFMILTVSWICELFFGIHFDGWLFQVLGVAFYAGYLIIDLKMIAGKASLYGTSIEYSFDDYILAAVQIYIDIIGLFLEILKFLAEN